MKCDNCDKDAVYTCADPGANPVNYCASCLPSWLQDRADAGHFPLTSQKPAEKSSKKKTETPADENN